tara:strand:- start:4055 stop:4837 length:783 start_codon:yes stop_codon:yes gene_type:complete
MIYNHKELLSTLHNLKENYNVIGIKSSFEDEGVKFEELIKLRQLCLSSDIFLNMKIGGCEAISDINNCLVLNVDGMVAPMVESPFALEKFITSLDNNLTPQLRQKMKYYINIESKTAYDNISDLISSDYCRFLNGIVLGRSDLCKSFGLTKSNVNDDEIFNIVKDVFQQAKEYKLNTIMGGSISVSSVDFISKLYKEKLLDKIETRNVVFQLDDNNVDNLVEAIKNAITFESLWLRSKSSYYMNIGNSYLNRASLLDERI